VIAHRLADAAIEFRFPAFNPMLFSNKE